MTDKWHIHIDPCYSEVVRIKHKGSDYIKAHIRTYVKLSDRLIGEERNVGIPISNFKWLERYV